jgi:SAM-dependent methyltransferase
MVKTGFASPLEKVVNFALFPYRAFILNPNHSSPRLMCLRDERMSAVRGFCVGRVLDIGCGPGDVFSRHFLDGQGIGIDVYPYEGLAPSQIVKPPLPLPFADATFDTVTLIANVNHIPRSIFREEFSEIARVLKPRGRLVMTRIGLVVSLLTHTVVKIQSKLSTAYYDMDTDRGMEEDERYSVVRSEILAVAMSAGLHHELTRSLWTQWFLNEVMVLRKQ